MHFSISSAFSFCPSSIRRRAHPYLASVLAFERWSTSFAHALSFRRSRHFCVYLRLRFSPPMNIYEIVSIILEAESTY
jgi:hypothetical protein